MVVIGISFLHKGNNMKIGDEVTIGKGREFVATEHLEDGRDWCGQCDCTAFEVYRRRCQLLRTARYAGRLYI